MKSAATKTITQKELEFRIAMRTLWDDHTTWTRAAIVSVAGDLQDVNSVVNRLMKNQEDIGNAIKPFYGSEAGSKVTELLKEHIQQAYDLLVAAKAGEQEKVDSVNKAWFENADKIASFLTAANPRYWPIDMTKKHMHDHLELTLHEGVVRIQGKWEEDVKAWDAAHAQIFTMADMLSDGIIRQFPGTFQ
jgi:hypothetical protein